MAVRIYTPSALLQPADFTIEQPILEKDYPQANSDGSRPAVTVKVEADRIRTALQVLKEWNETENFMEFAVTTVLGEDVVQQMVADGKIEELRAVTNELHDPFLQLAYNGNFEVAEEGEETVVEKVNITVTVPSIQIGFRYFQHVTSPKQLNALATSFMPLEETDDDFYDEDDYEN